VGDDAFDLSFSPQPVAKPVPVYLFAHDTYITATKSRYQTQWQARSRCDKVAEHLVVERERMQKKNDEEEQRRRGQRNLMLLLFRQSLRRAALIAALLVHL
jgi:hypothetical protein